MRPKVRIASTDVLALLGLVLVIVGLVAGISALAIAGAAVFAAVFILAVFNVLVRGKGRKTDATDGQ